MAPSHLLFVDDIFIFANSRTKELKLLYKWLALYQETSGQVFSSEKSKLYLGAMTNVKKQKVKDIFGFDEGYLPTTYLGIPLVQGRVTKEVFMGIYKWPVSVIKEGEQILRNFLWSGEPESTKACVVAWDKVCKPYKEGGINLRRLKEINQSLMMKLSWNFLNPKDEWAEFMRAKFITKSGNFSTITKGSSIWAGVRGPLEDVSAHSGWVIGDGKCIDLWHDNWYSPLSLKDIINDDAIPWTDLNTKELPNHGEIKINIDGAARGNPGKGSIGCIFRDSKGKILGSFAQGLGLVSNYTAECKVIIKWVDLVASNGWLIAWVESDSKAAVEAFHSDNIPWILEAEWANAKRSMQQIRISATWREASFSVDALSKRGAYLLDGLCEFSLSGPEFLKRIEIPMQEYFRFC
ncbi:hypothetical protein GIB67_029480 [Kingdonia uniflora]|uniref:RNase H type-1 domain-containing protein n=1 Tax=Kingdonia uniflora TaxID=39325 RepID=A0A7J7NYJ6_9MAGN|nr:hypothetical protein GIB67_029480 [Kingdonia uniflora]